MSHMPFRSRLTVGRCSVACDQGSYNGYVARHSHLKDAVEANYQLMNPRVARCVIEAAIHIDAAPNSRLKKMTYKRFDVVVMMVTYSQQGNR
jgi:hypothetical protein